jgi:aquaporin Z
VEEVKPHWREWLAEFVGTGLLIVGGLGALTLDFGRHSLVAPFLSSHSLRLLLTGVLFAGTGSLIALSPLGRISGAHLNPAVSIAFWLSRKMHPHDLGAYIAAQCAGAVAGTALLKAAWPDFASVGYGVTQPASWLGVPGALAVECAMTAALVLTILLCVSSTRTARWTPLAVWIVVTILVWQGASMTGTSLNPARSLGPALVAPNLHDFWIYLAGPTLGAALATLLVVSGLRLRPVTAKLFHDPRFTSIFMHDRM